MAKRLEQWGARDGSIHPSAEQADARDNDLSLLEALEEYTGKMYGALQDGDTPWRRMEQRSLLQVLFTHRKPLLDALLRHSAGPTQRPIPTPAQPTTQARPPAPALPPAEAPQPPLELTADMAIPKAPEVVRRDGPESSIPDNFRFGGKG